MKQYLVALEDGREMVVPEYALMGRVQGEPGAWRAGDACRIALLSHAIIHGTNKTYCVEVGRVSGLIKEIVEEKPK